MARLAVLLAGLLAPGCFGGGGAARPQELPPRIRPPHAIGARGKPPAVSPGQAPAGADGDDAVIAIGALCFDACEFSNRRYRRFLEAVASEGHRFCHPDEPPGKDHTPAWWTDPRFDHPEQPVVGLDWFDAFACARFVGARLPTAAEWDLAARGLEGRRYPWGDQDDPQRYNHGSSQPPWYDESDGYLYPAPVGGPGDLSPDGVQGLMGNVREWCADGPEARRHVRGQAWYQNYGQAIGDLAQAIELDPLERSFTVGFRCVRDAQRSTAEQKP